MLSTRDRKNKYPDSPWDMFSRQAYRNNHKEGSGERGSASPQSRTIPRHSCHRGDLPTPNGKSWQGDWKQPSRGEPDVTEKWIYLKYHLNENPLEGTGSLALPALVLPAWEWPGSPGGRRPPSPSSPGHWESVRPCPEARCTPAPHRASAACSVARSAPPAWPPWTGPCLCYFSGCSTSWCYWCWGRVPASKSFFWTSFPHHLPGQVLKGKWAWLSL